MLRTITLLGLEFEGDVMSKRCQCSSQGQCQSQGLDLRDQIKAKTLGLEAKAIKIWLQGQGLASRTTSLLNWNQIFNVHDYSWTIPVEASLINVYKLMTNNNNNKKIYCSARHGRHIRHRNWNIFVLIWSKTDHFPQSYEEKTTSAFRYLTLTFGLSTCQNAAFR